MPASTNAQQSLTSLSPKNLRNWQQIDSHNHIINGYHQQGDKNAPRLHFLHGTGFSSMTLAPMASQLPQHWDLWFSDVPGHGLSTQPSKRMPDWQKLAKNIGAALMAQADVENKGPLIGVGHSMGGVVTLMAAVQYPKLFSKIILLDPVFFQTELIIAQYLMRKTGIWKKSQLVKSVSNRKSTWHNATAMKEELASKQLYKNWQPEVLEHFVEYATQRNDDNSLSLCCNPKWEGSFFGSYPKGLWRSVHKVNVPVEILIAKKSYSFIPRGAKRAAKSNSNITWQTFGERHCFPMEQPEQTAEILRKIV